MPQGDHARGVFWIAALTIIESVQAVVVLGWVLSFFPPSSPMASTVYKEWLDMFRPEWEMLLLRFFVVFAVVFHSAAFYRWQRRAHHTVALARLKEFLGVEVVVTFLMLSAVFKMAIYADRPQLASLAFKALLAVALVNKIFWPQISRWGRAIKDFLAREDKRALFSRLLTVLMPAAIFLIIDVPNVPAVIARFFVGEQFHHNDSFIFGPGWAYATGCVPNVDIISQYGAGVGIVFGTVGRWLGGFSYESGFCAMVYATILYYVLCFIFLRRWLASAALAAAGVLAAIKIQMFHTGVYPFVFTYGSATVVRYWFDIFFLLAIAAHIQKPSRWFLAAAAAACGAQIFYIPTEGLYLTGAYWSYMLAHLCRREWRRHMGLGLSRAPLGLALMILPFAVAFVLLRIFVGEAILTPVFWRHTGEFIEYFLSGFGVTPMTSSLLDKQFLASLMGFVVPSVYVLTLLVVGTLLFLGKIHRRHMMVLVLCVYGLGLYHYYVARSAVTSYYVVAIPYVMILCFWIKIILGYWSEAARLKAKWALCALAVWALATNHNFLSYPNRLNFSRNPMTDPLVAQPLDKGKPYFDHLFRDYPEQLKVPLNSLGEAEEHFVRESDFSSDKMLAAYYRKEGDFSVDAALIDRLTGPGDPVPLISSFEIKILMQARRRPYFYYFPLVISHPMRARNFVRTSIYTTDQLNRVVEGLQRDKPKHIFLEKIFLTRPVPAYFYYEYSSFMYLTDYVLAYYTPVEQGQYLAALRRREDIK